MAKPFSGWSAVDSTVAFGCRSGCQRVSDRFGNRPSVADSICHPGRIDSPQHARHGMRGWKANPWFDVDALVLCCMLSQMSTFEDHSGSASNRSESVGEDPEIVVPRAEVSNEKKGRGKKMGTWDS